MEGGSSLSALSREVFAPRLQAGAQLGDYVLGQPLWPLRVADAYRANGPKGAATVYVMHAAIAGNAAVRDQIVAGTRGAAALPEHKHLVHTLAAGLTGDILWIATEEVDGQLVRDMLVKKRQAGAGGIGVRSTANLIAGVAAALSEARHGALSAESVVVNRTGRVRVIDLALGAGTAAAIAAKLVPANGAVAPEVTAGGAATSASDVFQTGALIYEALVGVPLERGGPRPSDVVQGLSKQIDEIVAKACHQNPDKRYGHIDVLAEVVAEVLGKADAGGPPRMSMQMAAAPAPAAPAASLAAEIAAPAGTPAASGNMVIDRALGAALADTTEKWLISKGRLDYGPFSLAEVVKQIDKGDIVGGNLIMDKDTGARVDIAEHPLLGPVVDAARQRIDDQRRAQAEVAVQSAEKKRGAMLYAVIGLGVLGAAAGVYFIIGAVRSGDKAKEAKTIGGIEAASIDGVKATLPKAPPKHSGGHGGGGNRNWGPGNANENLSLDLSDDSDETETLGMDKVFAVYSHYGGQLGGCLSGGGAGQANISIIIDGPSGRVNFVKVNGQATGPLWGCINRVMRSMQFPTIHGPRTRAEFDIGL